MTNRSSRLLFLAIALLALSLAARAGDSLLRPDHPDTYVVQKGDTLWDIAGRFLQKPWRWPELWQANPKIRNPHLIYPGDRLTLMYVDGRPALRLERGGSGKGVVKLSPQVRARPVPKAIPAIPIDHIAPYLSRPYVMDRHKMKHLPYVVAFDDEHLAAGAGQRLYVRKIEDGSQRAFDLIRPGKAYRHGETGEIIGYEAIYAGSATLERTGDPATVDVTRSSREILVGDRLVPFTENNAATDFHPSAPRQPVHGTIIDVLDRVNEIGQYDVVVLDLGRRDGITEGTVLQIDNHGETVPDRTARAQRNLIPDVAEYTMDDVLTHHIEFEGWQRPSLWESVQLPDEEAGLLMVFRTFDRVSFGLVMYARRAIHLHDRVKNP